MAAWLTHLIILMMFAVSWHLHFILYLHFFFFASKLTGWTEPTFTLFLLFFFLTYCPTLRTRRRILVSIFISIIFDMRCQFLHSFHFVLVHFSHATETANYQQWNCVCVRGNVVNFHCFLLSVRLGATKKQMMTLTAVKLSLFDFIIINSGQASLIIE